jgi:hypothetical protein
MEYICKKKLIGFEKGEIYFLNYNIGDDYYTSKNLQIYCQNDFFDFFESVVERRKRKLNKLC